MVEVGDQNLDAIPKRELKRRYAQYCSEIRTRQSSDREIKAGLLAAFEVFEEQHTSDNGKRERVWAGIRWKDAQATQDTQQKTINQTLFSKNDGQKNGVQGANPVQPYSGGHSQ